MEFFILYFQLFSWFNIIKKQIIKNEYGNSQKIIRMMLELKNCKQAVVKRTTHEVLG